MTEIKFLKKENLLYEIYFPNPKKDFLICSFEASHFLLYVVKNFEDRELSNFFQYLAFIKIILTNFCWCKFDALLFLFLPSLY